MTAAVGELSREAIAAVDASGQLDDILGCPTSCATRCGGSSRQRSSPTTRPAG